MPHRLVSVRTAAGTYVLEDTSFQGIAQVTKGAINVSYNCPLLQS